MGKYRQWLRRCAALILPALIAVAAFPLAACDKKTIGFSDEMPGRITVGDMFSVQPYLESDGSDVELIAEYEAGGLKQQYAVTGLSFSPSELGEVTLTVRYREKPSVSAQKKVMSVEAPALVVSSTAAELEEGETLEFARLTEQNIVWSCITPVTLKTVRLIDYNNETVFEGERDSYTFDGAGIYTLVYILVSENGSESAEYKTTISVGGVKGFDNYSDPALGTVTTYPDQPGKVTLHTNELGEGGVENHYAYVVTDDRFVNEMFTLRTEDSLNNFSLGLRADRTDWIDINTSNVGSNHYYGFEFTGSTVQPRLVNITFDPVGYLETKTVDFGEPGQEKRVSAAVMTAQGVTKLLLQVQVEDEAPQTFIWFDKTEAWDAAGRVPCASGHAILWSKDRGRDFTFQFGLRPISGYHYATEGVGSAPENRTVQLTEIVKYVPVLSDSLRIRTVGVDGGAPTEIEGREFTFGPAGQTYTFGYEYAEGGVRKQGELSVVTVMEGAVSSECYGPNGKTSSSTDVVLDDGSVIGSVTRYPDAGKVTLRTAAHGKGEKYANIFTQGTFSDETLTLVTRDSLSGVFVMLRADKPNWFSASGNANVDGNHGYLIGFTENSVRVWLINRNVRALEEKRVDFGSGGAVTVRAAAVTEGGRTEIRVSVTAGADTQSFVWQDDADLWTATRGSAAPERGHLMIWSTEAGRDFTFNFGMTE